MTISASTRVPHFKGTGRPSIQKTPYDALHPHPLGVRVALLGILFPPILFSLGTVNVTPGRAIVIILLSPALAILSKSNRNRVPTDFFVIALSAWMVVASILNGGFRPYVFAESLELLGAYVTGRAFIFGPANLRTFIRTFELVTIVIAALALLDTLSGQYVTLRTLGIPGIIEDLNLRHGVLRAGSVFEGGEQCGTFFAAAAAIFFYSDRGVRRILFVALSSFGCLLALSSGPLIGLGIVMASFCYDRSLKKYSWRWKVLAATITTFIGIISIAMQHPVEWMLVHLTFDPETGFWRLGTWDAALPLINVSPFVGYGIINFIGSAEMMRQLASVDCVWLMEALRYGLPAVILLVLTMFSSFSTKKALSTIDQSTHQMRTGFTLAIVTIGLVGLTVHFWNGVWMFLFLCIGIRASIAEYETWVKKH